MTLLSFPSVLRGAPILALILAYLSPAAAQEAPVRDVTLFEAGLAELTRATGAAREVTLQVPLRDVNDVLKSLLLRGDGIVGASVTLDGPQPVEDAFASLPFPPAAATDLSLLLRSVPGLRVRLSDRAYPEGREGTLMGVHEDCTPEAGCDTVLTILGDDGVIRRQVFDEGLDLTILDAAITDALGRGLAALREAASGTTREVSVAIEGDAIRDGALTYAIAAPAWKTAYRALTGPGGEVDLQAWAVVENATGEDWEDVSLTLSSGSPRTLTADLHGRDWRYREMVTPADARAAAPVVVVEPEAASLADAVVGAFSDQMAEDVAPAAPPASLEAAAQGSEGVLDSRYAFAAPVDLAAGEMISLPFLTNALEASHLSVYRGAWATRTGNPEMVLELTNDLGVRLPAGIMTVSDETGGYVGDADFPLVGPGETRAVPYGLDRKLRVEEQVSVANHQVSVRASQGVLRITYEDVREVTYLVTSPSGEPREVAIDHPLTPDWVTTVISGPPGTERQEDDGRRWLRAEMEVGAGDAEGVKLVVRDVHPYEQVVALEPLDEATILSWAGQVTDEADRAYLDEAARLAREVSLARTDLGRIEEEHRGLVAEQNRIRTLLRTVPNPSEAYDRFLAELLALEDRIDMAAAAAQAARQALATAHDAFAAQVSER